MTPIKINFETDERGRVDFEADVTTFDSKSLRPIKFKLDTASDFTTLSDEALERLGYTEELLLNECNDITHKAITGAGEIPLRHIDNVSIKFGDREIQHARVFFMLKKDLDIKIRQAIDKGEIKQPKLNTLLGSDLMKHFNFTVNYDDLELTLWKTTRTPKLSQGEKPIQIYSVEKD
ncbi:MAG: retropepsin-like domain-containing protein [Oscillospiraceae bacterium]|nr:retropepsin-like domain-containing protein [Oscillospiraceae bacterium]